MLLVPREFLTMNMNSKNFTKMNLLVIIYMRKLKKFDLTSLKGKYRLTRRIFVERRSHGHKMTIM